MSTAPNPPGRLRRRLRHLAISLAILGGAAALHEEILAAVGSVLVTGSPRSLPSAVLVLDGKSCVNAAEKLSSEGVTKFLLHRRRPGRLERMGIVPPVNEIVEQELLRRGIPDHCVQYVSDGPIHRSELVEAIEVWLRRHPQDSLGVLCDRLGSRTWSWRIGRLEDEDCRDRINIIPVSTPEYDESNWWKTKLGTLAFMQASLSLGFEMLGGQQRAEWREPTDAELMAAFAGVPPK